MEEIEFRAWVVEEKHNWSCTSPPAPYMTGPFSFTDFDGDYFKPTSCSFDEMTIMQYTDLKDKNGKRYCKDDIFVDTRTGLKYRVIKQNAAFWGEPIDWELMGENYCLTLLCHIHVLSEIIGNVNENPELLEG